MNLPFNIKERERKFLVIGGIAVLLVVLYQSFSWYSNLKEHVKDVTYSKQFLLQKQLNKLSEKEEIEKRIKEAVQELKLEERAFLSGDKPPVAASALQKFLKDTASSLNIDVKVERTLNPVETESYLGIPVEIGFTATIKELTDLLFRIRKSRFMLTVSEMKIKVTNIRNPEEIYTTLIVNGFIKKPEIKEQDEKKVKDAA